MNKIITIGKITIKVSVNNRFYSCYLPNYNMYFSTSIKDGEEGIYKKAIAMIKCKRDFLRKFPEYNK